MSNIKALDMLREKIQLDVNNPWSDLKGELLAMCDKVEREVSERYIPLPVDMDGVPIHYGDSLSYCGEHGGTVTCKVSNMEYRERSYGEADWLVNAAGWVFPGDTAHVNPRTIEDVLTDFANEVARQGHQIGLTGHELAMRYADEICEVLGVSE